jgi:predicted alpha/beta hydrolase family esterase
LVAPGWKGGDKDYLVRRLDRTSCRTRAVSSSAISRHRPCPIGPDEVEKQILLSERPVALVGHSLGALTIAHMAGTLAKLPVIAAFLVTPPELDGPSTIGPMLTGFESMPTDPTAGAILPGGQPHRPLCQLRVCASLRQCLGIGAH